MEFSRRAALISLSAFCACSSPIAKNRPRQWAQPKATTGVPNLHQITPHLWRSAQPTSLGFANLETTPIKTVISLRLSTTDAQIAPNSSLKFHSVPMRAEYIGEDQSRKIITAFKTINSALPKGPVLIHCTHGADRTGAIAALYRVLYQGWSRDAAIDELTHGGFGFHPIFTNIPAYLAQVDIEELRAKIEA